MEQYKDFAFVYDELMNEVDYNGWVKYIEDIIKNIGKLEKDINFISHNNSILLAKKMNNKEKEIIKGL